jgi:predicted negative regulator of RcsB-dependent stress response
MGGSGTVKKLFVLVLLVFGGFVGWQRYQARRADLDLWTEATTPDDF